MEKFSERLGLITEEQFQKALNLFDLGKFIKAEPITQGLFGQNVYVSSDKGSFVLRGKPHYAWQFKNEKLMVDLLSQNTTVPVPYPYLLSKDIEIFGWEFVLMPRMRGKNLSDSLAEDYLTDNHRTQIAVAQGKLLKEAQKLTNTFCGTYDLTTNAVRPYENEWFEFYTKQIMDLLQKSTGYNNNTTDLDLKWVSEVIAESESFMETFTPTFYMQDFKPGNMVVDLEKGAYKVSGLFDFMEASFGHPEADLSRMFAVYIECDRYDLAYEFISAYLSHDVNINRFIKRFPLFMLHDRAIIWEYRQRKRRGWKNVFWNDNYTFREWVSNYINIDPTKRKHFT